MISREKETSPEGVSEKVVEKVVFDKNLDLVFEFKKAGRKVLSPCECYLQDKEGNRVFDFANLLPPGYKLVRFLPPEPVIWGHISDGEKMIAVGELHNSKQIMSLLHEIGHSYQGDLISERNQYLIKIQELDKQKDKLIEEFDQAINKQEIRQKIKQCENERKILEQEKIKLQAKIERGAWEFVRQAVQDIRVKYQIDLLKPFKNQKEFEEFISSALDTYAIHVARQFGPEMGKLFSDRDKLSKYLDIRKKYLKFRE